MERICRTFQKVREICTLITLRNQSTNKKRRKNWKYCTSVLPPFSPFVGFELHAEGSIKHKIIVKVVGVSYPVEANICTQRL